MNNVCRSLDEITRLLLLVQPQSELGQRSIKDIKERVEELRGVMCPTVREDLIEKIVEILSQWIPGTTFTTLDIYERFDESYGEVVSAMREIFNRGLLGERELITIPTREVDDDVVVEQLWQYKIGGEDDEIDT